MKKCKKRPVFIMRWMPALAVILMLLGGFSARAQSPVKGNLRDKEGNPVAGATISVKGKKVNNSALLGTINNSLKDWGKWGRFYMKEIML